MNQILTNKQKEELFQRVIINNAANRFVYNQLRQTLIDNPNVTVPFVGAGLSQFSYKAWGGLLQDLLDQLADQAIDEPRRADIQDKINRGEFFQAADDLETLIESDVFFFSLVSACNESKLVYEGIPDGAAVKWLPKVFPESRIITTNYDCVLEMAYAQDRKYLRVCTPSDSRMFMQFMPRRLFKIHGSYDSNYEDIVLTSRSYEEKYAKGSLLYNNFKHIVQSSVLFFLGASLRSDKTLDILKEIGEELTVGGHYCGNMHYAIVRIGGDEDKIERRKQLAEYKILPIIYTDKDHEGYNDRHAALGVILEKLYNEVTNLILQKTAPAAESQNNKKIKFSSRKRHQHDEKMNYNSDENALNERILDVRLIAQLLKQDPLKAFTYAVSHKDLTLAENMLAILEHALPREIYLTKILTVLAAEGSTKAAQALFNSMEEFVNGGYSTSQIIDVAGALVTYCVKQDKELEHLNTLTLLMSAALSNATPEESAAVYNQLSRLHHGIYMTDTSKQEYKDKAVSYLKKAVELDDAEPSYYYNLAVIQKDDDTAAAKDAIESCLDLNSTDVDHLSLAYQIYRKMNDPKADRFLRKIQSVDPLAANMLVSDAAD